MFKLDICKKIKGYVYGELLSYYWLHSIQSLKFRDVGFNKFNMRQLGIYGGNADILVMKRAMVKDHLACLANTL